MKKPSNADKNSRNVIIRPTIRGGNHDNKTQKFYSR